MKAAYPFSLIGAILSGVAKATGGFSSTCDEISVYGLPQMPVSIKHDSILIIFLSKSPYKTTLSKL